MLRSRLALAAVASSFALAWLACSGNTETNNASDSTTGSPSGGDSTSSGSGGNYTPAEPPDPPPNTPPDGTGSVTFAISELFLGDTDRQGNVDANAWKDIGFDIDHKNTTATSTDVCKPAPGGSKAVAYPDGNKGIDNSFGKNIVPLIGELANLGSTVNGALSSGKFTIMLDLQQLGTGSAYNPLVTRLYGGADLGAAPQFDGTDVWPVLPQLLNCASSGCVPTDIDNPKVVFNNSYVANNTWVSGGKGTVELDLSVQGYDLKLTINGAQIAFHMDDAHQHVTNGTISGVLETEVLIQEVTKIAGGISTSFCGGGGILQGVLDQVRGFSDIMADGTQNPNAACTGISVGLGFNAERVQIGPIAPLAPPGPDPCSDAGTTP